MQESQNHALKEFLAETEEILKILLVENSFLKNWKRVVDYLESFTNFSLQLLGENDIKNGAQVLVKLENVCCEVLKNFPGDIDPDRKLSLFFNTKDKKNNEETRINAPEIIKMLQVVITLRDITEIKTPSTFAYYLVLEYYLQITNNIAFISFKRNKLDKALYFLLQGTKCLSLIKFSSYYIKYHTSTLLINLIYLLDESHLNDTYQILTNVVLLLEKIEAEVDGSKNRDPIYMYINDRAFNFSFMLDPKNKNLQEKEYKNNKSFLVARMCICYEYYSEILEELSKPKEAEVSRKQAEFLEKQLDKMEISLMPSKAEEKVLTKENLNRVDGTKNQVAKNTTEYDAISASSFNTTLTGFTGSSTIEAITKINKDNIIFQKYVEVSQVKFKIIMAHLKEIQSLEIVVYSKERNLLKKAFIHFQEVINYARKTDVELIEEKDINKILTKIARLLYFKEGELYMKEIPYFRSLEEMAKLFSI